MQFGDYFNSLRIKQGLTLRKFAEKFDEDPAYISRLERGRVRAPKSNEKLEFYANALGLKKGSEGFDKFFQLAQVSNKSYGIENINDEKLLEKLPVFLRTLDNKGLDEERLESLLKSIKEDW